MVAIDSFLKTIKWVPALEDVRVNEQEGLQEIVQIKLKSPASTLKGDWLGKRKIDPIVLPHCASALLRARGVLPLWPDRGRSQV